MATQQQDDQLIEIRQALIQAGANETHVSGLDETGLWITLHMINAGHSVSALCPPPFQNQEDYWRDQYGER